MSTTSGGGGRPRRTWACSTALTANLHGPQRRSRQTTRHGPDSLFLNLRGRTRGTFIRRINARRRTGAPRRDSARCSGRTAWPWRPAARAAVRERRACRRTGGGGGRDALARRGRRDGRKGRDAVKGTVTVIWSDDRRIASVATMCTHAHGGSSPAHRRQSQHARCLHGRRYRYSSGRHELQGYVGILRVARVYVGQVLGPVSSTSSSRLAPADLDPEPLQLFIVLLHTARHLPCRPSSAHRLRYLGPPAVLGVSRPHAE